MRRFFSMLGAVPF